MRRTESILLRALLLALPVVLAVLTGCAVNPATGKRQISLVSESRERQMGQESDPAILAEYGLYGDQAMQAYVDSIGQKLAATSHMPGLTWHFRVLDSPVVNAFALPGGYIYITRGILAYLNSEAQLAGVLGHEIGHVTARHTAQQITRQEIAGLGLIVGAVFIESFRPYSGLAQQGLGLLFLKYGRDAETQADELGVEYAQKAGFDPREIPGTYAMLKRVQDRSGASLPTFLSTHPDPGDREIRTTQLSQASAASTQRKLVVNAGVYRKHIEGLIYGDDPRAGYFDGNRFYHPDMGFQMIFPDGWETANRPSAVIARNQGASAGMELTLQTAKDSTLTPALYVESLRRDGKISDAAGRSESFRDYNAWIGDVIASGEGGQSQFIAGFVRYRPGQFFQVLGQARSTSDPAAEQIRASIRSLAALRDTTKLTVAPDRLRVVGAPKSGPFSEVVNALGSQGMTLEETAILNNLRATTPVSAGSPIKIVRKGKRG